MLGSSDHGCNAYCRDGQHCDLVYTSGTSGVVLGKRYADILRVDVTRIEPAREAPPIEVMLERGYEVLAGDHPADGTRWLVWWRRPVGRWVRPTWGEMRACAPEED